MQVIIAGSRGIEDLQLVAAAIVASGFDITEVLSGTCRGVDLLAERWAMARSIPVKRYPAEWHRFGKRAGPLRNIAMVNEVASSRGGLIAVWDGISRGTRQAIEYAHQQGISVYVHRVGITSADPGTSW
jgi:hypothetical protein